MAIITNPSIQVSPSQTIGTFRFEVSFSVIFTPMERLLAQNGLQFRDLISLYEVDLGIVWPNFPYDYDDFLPPRIRNTITSENMLNMDSSNTINITRSFLRTWDTLRGPDGERQDSNTYDRQIEARIEIVPIPSNATEVTGYSTDSGTSGTVIVDTTAAGGIDP